MHWNVQFLKINQKKGSDQFDILFFPINGINFSLNNSEDYCGY